MAPPPKPLLDTIIPEIRSWSTEQETAVLDDARITRILNWELQEIVRLHDIWFCRGMNTVSLVGGTRQYAAPTLLSRPTAAYTLGTSRVDYDVLMPEEFDNMFPAVGLQASETPSIAQEGTYIYVAPTPTASAALYIKGYYYPGVLSVVAPTVYSNIFTTYAEKLCVFVVLNALVKWGFEESSRGKLFDEEMQKAIRAIQFEGKRRLSSARKIISQRKG